MTTAKYADDYAAALTAAGYSSDVYDVDANGRTQPHHPGVLGHYDAIVWESGDDIITRAPGQVGGTADKLALDIELSVRDYLNEGGKAPVTGQYNQFAQAANGVYDYNPFAPPQCTTPDTYPCLPLFNDFMQYWLGAYNYVSDGGTGEDGPFPVTGAAGAFDGFAGTFNGGDSADNRAHTASLLATSSFLPEADFPQFASAAPLKWGRPGAAPYDPHTGEWFMFSQWADQGLEAADADGRPDRRHVRVAGLPAVARHGARLGLRHRRGTPGRLRRLDHAAGRQRPHRAGHRRLVRLGLGGHPPVRGPLPGCRLLAHRHHG
ncbi:hypothetical protein [Nocardioides sp. B-3]|uniref:hypothetical protein n=1 Tax=Nocardioides sp. B-3 TaxID=2895565 RepID=UPI0021538D0F|nr:hypothetical protein [Nocardioides sp. B-3]UUZ60638.1 hypothetical protein LP418_07360 [Nocardioides sp. B-3]